MDIAEILATSSVILLLVGCSAFFSGSETALTAASRMRLHQLERSGDRRAAAATSLLEARERLIGSLLFGNNVVNILASTLAASVFISVFGDAGVVYATLAMTAAILIFAEALPKTYALRDPERAALAAAPWVRLAVSLSAPAAIALNAAVRGLLSLTRRRGSGGEPSALEAIRGTIDFHHRSGGMMRVERDMLDGILNLRSLEIGEIMIHRTEMTTLSADDSLDVMLETIVSSGHSRFPVVRGGSIVGILHAKTLLAAARRLGSGRESEAIESSIGKPWFVPETGTVYDQLHRFRESRRHFALVVDEYGEVRGLVTLEDVLEEIVGDIRDEHDSASDSVVRDGDGWSVSGSLSIRDLNRALELSLPEDEATTVAGLLLEEAETIPDVGGSASSGGMRLEATEKRGNRITRVRVSRMGGAEDDAA